MRSPRRGHVAYVGRLLRVYLNDHLAGATIGVQLVKRAARNNAGSELGELLERLTAEIVEDRATLEDVMARVGAKKSKVKPALAVVAERLGRLKLNGRLTEYSPLSRVLELEGLVLGVTGKRALWDALDKLADPRLAEIEFQALAERAERQRQELEAQRRAAAAFALRRD